VGGGGGGGGGCGVLDLKKNCKRYWNMLPLMLNRFWDIYICHTLKNLEKKTLIGYSNVGYFFHDKWHEYNKVP